jgi:hypothetical protein
MAASKEETVMSVLSVLLIAAAAGPVDLPMLQAPLLHPPIAAACVRFAGKTAGPGGAPFKRLGDLPPAQLEHAVLRSIGGCPVREIVYPGGVRYVPDGRPAIRPAAPAR